MLGICGVYCGACTTYRAYNDNDQALFDWEVEMGMPRKEIYCEGCGSNLVNEWSANCDFRKCVRDKGITCCFECEDFPCTRLGDFSKTRPHRTLGLRNLLQLKEMSIEDWLRQQEERWTCSSCGKSYTGIVKNVQTAGRNSCPQLEKRARTPNITEKNSTLNFPIHDFVVRLSGFPKVRSGKTKT